jgi:hypothetical protein
MRNAMSRNGLLTLVLATALTLIAGGGTTSLAASTATATGHGAVAAKAKPKKKHKKRKKVAPKATGPALTVLGFGVNRLFLADGKTVTSGAECSEMVDGEGGSPIGPPQQVYLQVYVRASNIPGDAPVQIQDSLPEADEQLEVATLSPYGTWSKAFGPSRIGIGAPPGSQKNVFSTLIVSSSDEAGQNEGPSAEDFDGTYSFTASVQVAGHTLTSTAKGTVECPRLR